MAQRVEHNPPQDALAVLLTQGLEGANEAARVLVDAASKIKRRNRVASIFPNAASCLRLVSALLAEVDEGWLEGKIHLNMKN